MTRALALFALSALSACGGPDDPVGLTTTGSPAPATTADACEQRVQSACDNPGSVIRGTATVGPGSGPTTGDLFVALVHEASGGAAGGAYHHAVTYRDVDLSSPVPFALDMCEGGVMWSEENCEYSLLLVLDQNGDQSITKLLPDPGEPSHRASGLWVSCAADPPCLDLVLDCVDGPSCGAFDTLPECPCEAATCGSDFSLCNF